MDHRSAASRADSSRRRIGPHRTRHPPPDQTKRMRTSLSTWSTASRAASGYTAEVTIGKGESTMEVANMLDAKKIIVNKYSFYLRAKLTKQNILPGTYKVSSDMDYDRIFKVITTPTKGTENKK